MNVADGITSVKFIYKDWPDVYITQSGQQRTQPRIPQADQKAFWNIPSIALTPPPEPPYAPLYPAEVARSPVKPWNGTTLAHVVVVVDGAEIRICRHRSVRVVLWVEISGQGFL